MNSDKCYIIRHGQTYANLNKIYAKESNLTEVGIKQAEIAAKEVYKNYSELGFKTIISSPLTRALETAKIINKELKLPLEIIPELREGEIGELEGQPYDKVNHQAWQNWIAGGFIANGVESFEDSQKRVKIALEKISEHKSPLIVAHGGTFFQMMKLLEIANSDINFENCVLYCIEKTIIGYRIYQFFNQVEGYKLI
jgi:broad specificity phosphatase PhoE